MKKTKEKLLLGVFVLMSACAFSVAYAQEEDTDLLQSQTVPAQQGSQESAPTGELTSCFDYYRFGSVPVELSAETVRVAQGADLKIQGKVTNQNDYRVDDITVYGKIYYKKNFEKSSFGPDIIQMFPLAENISLEAGEEKTFTYVYHIPAALKPGNYQVAAFVVSHDRFNMAGLSFTSDVVGSLLNFSVVGEDRGSVYFDNTKTGLNNIPFHSAVSGLIQGVNKFIGCFFSCKVILQFSVKSNTLFIPSEPPLCFTIICFEMLVVSSLVIVPVPVNFIFIPTDEEVFIIF